MSTFSIKTKRKKIKHTILKMGNSIPTYLRNENNSEVDDYTDSDPEIDPDCLCTDSATDSIEIMPPNQSTKTIKFNFEDVTKIQGKLDEDEIVSLVFLLIDDPDEALKQMESHFLQNWIRQQDETGQNWSEKLTEGLCIIQNYQVLKCLGLERKSLESRFLPHQSFTATHVSVFRKLLYAICERLDSKETKLFLRKIKTDFDLKNIPFPHYFDVNYLEKYFLKFEQRNYISRNNVQNIYKVLKQMECHELCELIKSVYPARKSDVKKTVADNPVQREVDIIDQILDDEVSLLDLASGSDISTKNRYYIDPDHPGVCLIINQVDFYREKDEKYKDLLPELNVDLETRDGSMKDCTDLETTFQQFGFRTIIETNLTHLKMIETITKITNEFRSESSLIICIMSHGEEGVVYGSNSCKVSVKQIQNIVCNENYKRLKGKPKVLILQSCQGDKCQAIPDEMDAFSFDGARNRPLSTDRFTFWATVPGFRAIRHRSNGSWFMQSLCEKMTQLAESHHFEDICTEVINDVSKKIWKVEKIKLAMVPLKDSTFTKQFYLPPKKKQFP